MTKGNKKKQQQPTISDVMGALKQMSIVPQPRTGKAKRRRKAKRTSASLPGLVSTGSDLVASLTIRAKSAVGTILFNGPIGPSHLTPSRFANESALWSRWRPRQLRLSITCSGAAVTYGSVCVAWCPDESWVPTTSASDYMRLAALKPSVTMRLYESKQLVIPTDTLTKWYQCNGSPDLSNHGSVVVVIAAMPGGFTGTLSVNITMDWTIQFEGIEMPGAAASLADVIQPDSGWTNIFTTSDGSFNAERLTFKMHSGGEMVSFTSAREDHIYEPYGDTKVPYYDESSVLRLCTWFARVQNFDQPGLLCFGSEDDARAYVLTGDVTKALKYKNAGTLTTPPVPRFKGKPVHSVAYTRDIALHVSLRDALKNATVDGDKVIVDKQLLDAARDQLIQVWPVNIPQEFPWYSGEP